MGESLLRPMTAPLAAATAAATAHAKYEAQSLLLFGVERVVEIAKRSQHARRAGLHGLQTLRDPSVSGFAIKALGLHKTGQILDEVGALDGGALHLHGFQQGDELGLLCFVQIEAAGHAIGDVLDARSLITFVMAVVGMVMAAVVVHAG